MQIQIKRAYAPASRGDGVRILVDRLWPRGLKKEDARIDRWARELAPSTELRRWFAHDPARWDEFRRRYTAELDARQDTIETFIHEIEGRRVTLLHAARDERHNNAVVLREYIASRIRQARAPA